MAPEKLEINEIDSVRFNRLKLTSRGENQRNTYTAEGQRSSYGAGIDDVIMIESKNQTPLTQERVPGFSTMNSVDTYTTEATSRRKKVQESH